MAAGVELQADSVEPFRRALAAHAGAALSPSDLRRREHVDAVVPGGALTLDLAEELERLRPFGSGNPQPSLLVPGARVENVVGDGRRAPARPLHARDRRRLALARRGVRLGARRRSRPATRRAPRHRAPARAQPLEGRGGAADPAARALRHPARPGPGARRGRLVLAAGRAPAGCPGHELAAGAGAA